MSSRSWTWRQAILKSALKPTTRHLLLTLSCHMNDMGGGCYPTTRTLAEETGLSERAVCTHLEIASDAGWIKVSQHGFKGQKWRQNQYEAAWPDDEGAERGSVPSEGEATEPDDRKVLNDVQCNSPENIPIPPHSPPRGDDLTEDQEFDDQVWRYRWEREGGHIREKALAQWRKLDATERQRCSDAVRWYRDVESKGTERRYRRALENFIRQRQWQGNEPAITRFVKAESEAAGRVKVDRHREPALYAALEAQAERRRGMRPACADHDAWLFEQADVAAARLQLASSRPHKGGGANLQAGLGI